MTILEELIKIYGEGSVIFGNESRESVAVIPTGSLTLDIALGVGGIPRGRIIELYGPESSGKTTLCQYIIANAQALGGICAYIDMEQSTDPSWLDVCGVDISNLYKAQPDYGEQALDMTERMIRSGELDLIVVDSVATLVPKAEIEGEMGDSHMGMHARLMSQALRKINPALKEHNCTLIFTNQLRMKIGTTGWGNPETTTGGEALKYYASVRIDLRRSEAMKTEGEQIGNKIKFTIRKNKVAAPYKSGLLTLNYGEGLDHYQEIIDLGIELGIIEKKGAWYSMKDERLGHGEKNVKVFLTENTIVFQGLEDQIRTCYGLPLRRME
jgi:recombination protein RecA